MEQKQGKKALVKIMGPRCREFESRHSDLKTAEMQNECLRFDLFLCIFEE